MNQHNCGGEFRLTITSARVTEPADGTMVSAVIDGLISAHALGHAFAVLTLSMFNESVERGLIAAKLNDVSSPGWRALQAEIAQGMQCALRNAAEHGAEGGTVQ